MKLPSLFNLCVAAAAIMGSTIGWAAVTAETGESAGLVQIAVLAAASGPVTTLQCYDPDPFASHPQHPGKPNPWAPCRTTNDSPPDSVTGYHGSGTAPTDIGAPRGTSVWFQNDYLPNGVRGGYLFAEDASAGCFAYQPGQSQYVGQRTRLWVYYYDGSSSSQYTDVHDVYQEHITQANINVWKKWNNYWATSPLWASWVVNYYLNNLTSGGMSLGTVAASGANPGSCATGEHVHQETGNAHQEDWDRSKYSEGCFYTGTGPTGDCTAAGYTWVTGQPVTGRYSDIQFLNIYVH